MKKKRMSGGYSYKEWFLKILLIMRLSLLLICLSLIQVSASTYSQNTKLDIKLDNASMKEVFKDIKKQSEFTFLYNVDDVEKLKSLNCDFKQSTVEEILDCCLSGTDMTYKIKDKVVIIVPKEKAKNKLKNEDDSEQSKEIKIKGKVTDSNKEPLPGVTITILGTTKGVITDMDGTYSIEVEPGEKLVFTFIGMESQIIEVVNQTTIDVKLEGKSEELEDIVVVGFGKQKKEDVIGSVVSLNVDEIKKVSSSNVTTMMAGNIAGMISYQRSGEPGADNADFFIRGVTTFGYKKDPLILIDGIEVSKTDLARMQPDDIANFSIMKDATSTAVYGARGANGVISITTKEGSEGKLSISVRFENAFSMPTQNIELADPITYMKLGNEAVRTRDPLGITPYSKSKIENTIRGTNKYVYPATDWYQELFNDHSTVQRFNLNASGGGKVARYYLAATFNQDNGNLKVDKRNNFNNNVRLSTYSFRSNINFNLTKVTEAALRITGSFDDYTGPINGGAEVYRQVMRTNPVLFPPYFAPDEANVATGHILFGNYGVDMAYVNPYAEMVRGYKDYSRSKIDAQFELKQDLSALTKGLSVRALFNTSRYSYFDVQRFYDPFYYMVGYYDKPIDKYVLSQLNEDTGTEYLGYREGTKEVSSSTYIEIMSNYNRIFAEDHSVSGMLVYTLRNSLSGNAGDLQLSLPHRNLGLSGRFTYSYKSKYFGEFNFGYNGSERFHKSHRYGFFPSAGIAWTISNEGFWHAPAISKLKLRATYGLVGNDAIGSDYDRFYYLSNVNMNNSSYGAQFGIPGSYYQRNGISVSRNSNESITWEIARKTNVGFELGLFDKFTMEADYFREHRNNILMDRAYIPTTMGLSATEKANVGEARSQGVDGSINYSTNVGQDFWLKGRVNFTYATSEFLVYEEPDYEEEYRKHIGHSLSQQWGLIAERLFIDDVEVTNSPIQQYGDYMGGDIKYHDVNKDGKISNEDRVPIGYPTDPEIIYGFGFSAGYKNFDFSCFFQGSARSSFWIDPASTSPFYNDHQLLKAYSESHWSEDNRDLYALWPRLSSTLISNNTQRSTWFMYDGSFLRLKSLEVGYTLPTTIMKKVHLSNARMYVNGTNLFCFSSFKLWDIEMGGNGLGYPIQKLFNVGLTVSF